MGMGVMTLGTLVTITISLYFTQYVPGGFAKDLT